MDSETFLNLSVAEVAALVQASGPLVCGFPINGTRRWYMLEQDLLSGQDAVTDYLDTMVQRMVSLCRLFFDHGVHTLLAPVFGPDLGERGQDYIEMMVQGLALLTSHPYFLNFYDACQVRVHFYGDYRQFFADTPYGYLLDQFAAVTARTAAYDGHRLLFGVCANDAVETTAELSIRYYTEHGRAPDKHDLVEMYYGEKLPPLSLFIGFDKFCEFDVPLLADGNEDLYFTVSPSLYLTERQLREILYDHLFTRRAKETDYSELTPTDMALMRELYRLNQGKTLGIGAKQPRGGYWYPLPQVELPSQFNEL
jgi:hypothetical protein